MANLQVIAERLKQGETISFRPHGNSMTPHIRSGALVTVRPITPDETLVKWMIVLAKVRGNIYLHFIRDINKKGRVLIGTGDHTNGWTTRDKVYGVLLKVSN